MDTNKFSIWDLSRIYKEYTAILSSLNIIKEIKDKLLNEEKDKIKFCRYSLDSKYNIQVFTYNDKIYIDHKYNSILFDRDIYDVDSNTMIIKSDIDLTASNMFDAIVEDLLANRKNIDDDTESIIACTYSKARYNHHQFKYLADHVKNKSLKCKIKSRMLLEELV